MTKPITQLITRKISSIMVNHRSYETDLQNLPVLQKCSITDQGEKEVVRIQSLWSRMILGWPVEIAPAKKTPKTRRWMVIKHIGADDEWFEGSNYNDDCAVGWGTIIRDKSRAEKIQRNHQAATDVRLILDPEFFKEQEKSHQAKKNAEGSATANA